MTRRAAIGSIGAGFTGLSGCIGRPWSTWERDSPSQVSIEILTPPEDDNIHALRIARHLGDNLELAGIQADVLPTRYSTFMREVLINHNYDMCVWRHPPQYDPDNHRELLHSQFAEERGWQNPYGYANSVVDDLLVSQHQTRNHEDRREYLADLQRVLIDERPFIPLAFEREHRLLRSDRVESTIEGHFHEPAWYYGLTTVEDDIESLSLGTTDNRLTQNLNPIAVEYRGYNGVLELVYESPGLRYGDEIIPRLATTWEWTSPELSRRPTLEIQLREDLTWHDGEDLTSEDVAFTYEFLLDTSMTGEDPNIPSPRFRAMTSLIDTIEPVDPHTIRLQFAPTTRSIANSLLTVPILPAHIWSELTDVIQVAGIPIDDVTTEALVEENLEPVGSGPYRVTDVSSDNMVSLERIEGHPLSETTHDLPSTEVSPPQVDELVIEIRPTASNITESIREGGLDGTIRGVGAELASNAREVEEVTEISEQSSRLFHIGFNLRRNPINHVGFRTAVEQLVDRLFIREEIFRGSARLARTSIYDDTYIPQDLQWSESDVDQFAGDPGTGEVDTDLARQPFREAGFSYSEGGDLLVN